MRRAIHGGMGDRARAHAGDRAPGMAAGRWVGGVRGAGGLGRAAEEERQQSSHGQNGAWG
jgi:hypothetical protein